ncbi:MAG: hypothetical protein WC459_05100, partial [Patescibacteria group bacterium]
GKFNLALDEKLRSRLDELAESFFAGARTKTQFKNSLMKSAETGGMGWEKEISGQVAEFFASYLRIKEIEKKKENKIPPGLPLQKGEMNPAVSLAPTPLKEERWGGSLKLDRPDFKPEEREAEKFKSKVMDLKSAMPPDLSKKMSDALKEIDLDFPSSELNDRLKNIIDARLRNVRTSVQTMERLTLAAANGGLGLSKEEADKVLLILNKYLDASNKDLYESSMSAIKEMEQKEKTEREQKESAKREQEEKNLNEKFKKLTGKEAPLPSTPVVPDVPSVVEGQYSGIQKKDGEKSFPTSLLQREGKEKKEFPPLEKEGQSGFKKESKPAFKIPIQPEEAPYFPIKKATLGANGGSQDSSSAVQSGKNGSIASPGRPVVEDIKFVSKLYGPLEEIGRMTLDDFRKLSSDPKEVILKIKDKLGLLRGESFKKYQMGVEAWCKSPVYGEYLKLLSETLVSALPLSDILAKSKTLTAEEFDAIINGRIDS